MYLLLPSHHLTIHLCNLKVNKLFRTSHYHVSDGNVKYRKRHLNKIYLAKELTKFWVGSVLAEW